MSSSLLSFSPKLTWNVAMSKSAIVTSKLKVAAAKEIVLGGIHSPVEGSEAQEKN